MHVGKEIDQIRRELKIPIYRMCSILGVAKKEYENVIKGKYKLSTRQLIYFIDATQRPLWSLDKRCRSSEKQKRPKTAGRK